MKTSNTQIRLLELMRERNLRQVDVLELCMRVAEKYDVKMNKSDISQYLSGKSEPGQEKLYIMSQALDVNVAWLMGYDVCADGRSSATELSSAEERLLSLYRELTNEGREKVMEYASDLAENPRYLKRGDSATIQLDKEA